MGSTFVKINIDLIAHINKINIREVDGKRYFFDPIRKKNIIMKPEELVRQLLLYFFIHIKQYPSSVIAVERGVKIGKTSKRFDIVIFNQQGRPWMLVECKSFSVELGMDAVLQNGQYNEKLKAPYLVLCNGKDLVCYYQSTEEKTSQFIDYLPDYNL